MHKMVNGKIVDMSSQEEADFLADQARGTAEIEQRKIEEEARKQLKESTKQKVKTALNLTDEEISSLFQ